MKKKFLVLTSITNNRDELTDPHEKYDNCDYLAYVDKKYNTKTWVEKSIYEFSFIDKYNSRRNAKIYKIISTLLFPDYEYIIWQDGNHQLKKNPQIIIEEYGDSDFYIFKHPDRKCAYEEMQACLNWNLDETLNLQNQYNFYKNEGFPIDYGLYELSTFITKNNDSTKEFQLMWYEQINKFTSRDQISFPFCIWKKNFINRISLLKGFSNIFYLDNQFIGNDYFFDKGKHLK